MNVVLNRIRTGLVTVGFALLALQAGAAESQSDALKRERATADAAYAKAAAACNERFAVNACKEKAREVHRTVMRRLRTLELAQSDAKRKQRAETYAARVEERRLAAVSAPVVAQAEGNSKGKPARVPAAGHHDEAVNAAPPSAGPEKGHAAKKKVEKTRKVPSHQGDAAAQTKREEFEARQREAAAHRGEVERRNTGRPDHKRAAPLPVPASGAGSAP